MTKHTKMKTKQYKKWWLLVVWIALVNPILAQTIQKPGSKNHKTTFAIVTDSRTAKEAATEIDAYRQALEAKGLGTYLVAHDWTKPEEIREILQNLYQEKKRLEGAVLVGDIPIAMIRDAQHLTSIFKMDQRHDWKRSSVPSDRFYDDFHLKFNFIKQDSTENNYFYYSLDAASPQHIQLSIYTARIKPPTVPGKDKYEQIREYLTKATFQHRQASRPLQHMANYSGHGYHTESMDAWAAERLALREELPQLFRPGSTATFLNFRMEPAMKHAVLNSLQNDNTDLFILHHHGSDDLQLLNGYPYVSNPQPSIDNVKRYLRNKIQDTHDRGADVEARKQYFHESLGVPIEWMTDALSDSVLLADSLLNASTDIHISDLIHNPPNARFVVLDACDNGAFHHSDYIAGHYPFGEGQNIAVFANSVGVAQDLWANEHLGLLPYGVRLGQWFKQVAYLESHLFGDPTFAFDGSYDIDLNQALTYPEKNIKIWSDATESGIPAIESLALKQYYWMSETRASELLKEKFNSSPHDIVRLQALLMLYRLDDSNYLEVLEKSLLDPYELTRRFAVTMVGENGDKKWLPEIMRLAVQDRYSERIQTKIRQVLPFFLADDAIEELDRQLDKSPWLSDKEALRKRLYQNLVNQQQSFAKNYQTPPNDFSETKQLLGAIRMMRAYRYHQAVPFVLEIIANEAASEDIKVTALEALSWFSKSYNRSVILEACQKLIDNSTTPLAVQSQARKTKAILQDNLRF